jgi:integrase
VLSKARAWNKNNRKQRIIPSKQLTDWYNAVVNLSNRKACVYLLMLLYMGFRCNEALLLEWRQVDLGEKKIHLFDTKNGTDHILPIPEQLLPHIQELKSITGHTKWAFPGVDESKPMSIPTKPMREVTRVSGVQFSPHDCRRTFSTIAEAISIPMSMIKRLLNHVTTNDVTGGYIVTEEDTLRQAVNRIADFIVNKVSEGEHHAENQSH